MLREKFYISMNKFEIYKDLYGNHSMVMGWQELFFPYKSFYSTAALSIATFEIYR